MSQLKAISGRVVYVVTRGGMLALGLAPVAFISMLIAGAGHHMPGEVHKDYAI